METSIFHTPHALAPDLDAIQAIARRRLHSPEGEGQAAMAIYEDVCWRLALAQFPPPVSAEVARLEGEAATLLRRYLAGDMAGRAFWQGFRDVVERLDDLTALEDAQAQDELEADHQLRALRARVAHDGLPPSIRRGVQTTLELLDDTLAAFHAGKLASADFWPLFEGGVTTIQSAMAGATALGSDAPEARLDRLTERLLEVPPPLYMRGAIASHLIALADACDAQRPLPMPALEALERLLERADQYRVAHDEAERRFRELSAAIAGCVLPAPFDQEATDQLAAMADMLAALEGGRLEPEALRDRFEVAAARLVQLMSLARPERVPLAEAEAKLAQARARVAEANLPRFVAITARDLLAYLEGLVESQRAPGEDTYAFWRAFREGLADLGLCLGFGQDVVHERTEALRRVERLERRVAGMALHPMVRGPVADLFEILRALLNRLDAGLFPLLEFHHAFDEAAERLEQLLAWQVTLGDTAGQF